MTNDSRFEIELLPKAEKDLDRLKSHRDNAVRELLNLEENPSWESLSRGVSRVLAG